MGKLFVSEMLQIFFIEYLKIYHIFFVQKNIHIRNF